MEESGGKISSGSRLPIAEEFGGHYLVGRGIQGSALKLCLHSKHTALTQLSCLFQVVPRRANGVQIRQMRQTLAAQPDGKGKIPTLLP